MMLSVGTGRGFAMLGIVGAVLARTAAGASGQPADRERNAGDTQPAQVAAGGAILTFGSFAKDGADPVQILAEDFQRCIPLLLEERINVVAVRFRPSSVDLAQAAAISDLFDTAYATKFRIVAWIEQSISTSVFVSYGFEEIYFTSGGVLGACTGFQSGALVNPTTRSVLTRLELGQRISARGGHDPLLLRAMMLSSSEDDRQALGLPHTGALSVTVSDDGAVRFYNDVTTGKIVLNPAKGVRILTLAAEDALRIKLSRGTAQTPAELADRLGTTIEWVGDKDLKSDWPVSKAERALRELHTRILDAENALGEALNVLNRSGDLLKSAKDAEQAAALRKEALNAFRQASEIAAKEPRAVDRKFGPRSQFDQHLASLARSLDLIPPADAKQAPAGDTADAQTPK